MMNVMDGDGFTIRMRAVVALSLHSPRNDGLVEVQECLFSSLSDTKMPKAANAVTASDIRSRVLAGMTANRACKIRFSA